MSSDARARAKAQSHARILASAGRLMRRRGLAAASVERVMRGAGLTVGGFYAHFRSKRALDAAALRAMLADIRRRLVVGLEEDAAPAWLARVVKRYLSPAHRDQVDQGCPLPAALSELGRGDADRGTRRALAEAIEILAIEVTARTPDVPGVSARERALATIALCVGGLTLARALRGQPLSDELIAAARRWALPEER